MMLGGMWRGTVTRHVYTYQGGNTMIAKVFQVLIAITATVICYYLIDWVLGILGIHPPERLMVAIFVFIGLVSIYGAITDRWAWWPPKA